MQIDWNDIWAGLKEQLNANLDRGLETDFLNRCVLSASGLRFIHSGDEQDLAKTPHRDAVDFALVVLSSFAEMFTASQPTLWLGMDARPTGPSLMLLAERFFSLKGFNVKLMGHGPIPEVMAATHQQGQDGFCYFTASHNPAGHNGFKLGFGDGAVLNREAASELIVSIKSKYEASYDLKAMKAALLESDLDLNVFTAQREKQKEESLKVYQDFALKTLNVESAGDWVREMAASWEENPLFLMDMNGSSRLASVDISLLESLGLELEVINSTLGTFAHEIVPEGASLEPLKELMQKRLDEGKPVLGGMVPDCDGDRGNLILPIQGQATALKAQETFALCALAEFASARSADGEVKLGLAGNGPTSLRLEALLEPYQVTVGRAEVGEANVLAKAKELRERGLKVPIAGEGSNGGNIMDGATVRDPLMTLLSLLKFTQTQTSSGKSAFEQCLEARGLSASKVGAWEQCFNILPKWHSTDAFEGDALMPVPKIEHEVLKQAYEKALQAHFETEPDFWKSKGIQQLAFFSNEGTQNIPGPGGRPAPGKGGLQVFLLDENQRRLGFLWMRGSGTEPVFRVVVDWQGAENQYLELLELHRKLISKSTN